MKRREFITGLVGAAAWPLAANGEQPIPMVGFLRSTTLRDAAHLLAALREGLKEAGFVDGQNIVIQYRSAEDHHDRDRLSALVAELIRRQAAVLVGNSPSALVAKAATTTVPIVFVTGGDPVRDG